MHKDPIIEEVRKARDAIAARYGYDLSALHQHFSEQPDPIKTDASKGNPMRRTARKQRTEKAPSKV